MGKGLTGQGHLGMYEYVCTLVHTLCITSLRVRIHSTLSKAHPSSLPTMTRPRRSAAKTAIESWSSPKYPMPLIHPENLISCNSSIWPSTISVYCIITTIIPSPLSLLLYLPLGILRMPSLSRTDDLTLVLSRDPRDNVQIPQHTITQRPHLVTLPFALFLPAFLSLIFFACSIPIGVKRKGKTGKSTGNGEGGGWPGTLHCIDTSATRMHCP